MIDTPSAPPGWEDARAELIRIVDPLGRGVAWLAPGHRGRCVGYAVRPSSEKGTPWRHLFDAVEPDSRSDGCGPACTLLLDDGDERDLAREWIFVQRDPTFARLESRADRVDCAFSATLDQGVLSLTLSATNTAAEPLRLHLTLDLAPATVLATAVVTLAPGGTHTLGASVE